jgi:glutamine amidotransferase
VEQIAVLDYGLSNLRSVVKALEHVASSGQKVSLCERAEDLRRADRIVFPGQGAIGDCMTNLRRLDLVETLRESIASKPYLGICLGLQSLMSSSDEDSGTKGLGIIPGRVTRFAAGLSDPRNGERLKIPHMGWNQVRIDKPHPLWEGIVDGSRFYFVHSYYVVPNASEDSAAHCDYGGPFCCALARDTLFAVQFHPEKSQVNGLRLLSNFLRWRI